MLLLLTTQWCCSPGSSFTRSTLLDDGLTRAQSHGGLTRSASAVPAGFPSLGLTVATLKELSNHPAVQRHWTTYLVCVLLVKPLTCAPGWRHVPTWTKEENEWYKRSYVNEETEAVPLGTLSYCELLVQQGKGDQVGEATVFVSHARKYKFSEVVAALESKSGGRISTFALALNFFIVLFSVFAPLPFLVALDLASTSSTADSLLDAISQAAIKHGPGSYHHVAWLESRLRKMNHDQGLGFKLQGSVVDKSVRDVGIAICGGASSLITTMLALSDEGSQSSAATVACGLDSAQELKVEQYARDLLANATCALNVTWGR